MISICLSNQNVYLYEANAMKKLKNIEDRRFFADHISFTYFSHSFNFAEPGEARCQKEHERIQKMRNVIEGKNR